MAKESSPIRRRYHRRLTVFVLLYAVLLVPVVVGHAHGFWPTGPLKYVLAVLPALPTFGLLWAGLRYVIEEEDEYLRLLNIRATIGAIGVTLAVCTAWGFLSTFAGAPSGNLIYVFVIYTVALFAAQAWTYWRAR